MKTFFAALLLAASKAHQPVDGVFAQLQATTDHVDFHMNILAEVCQGDCDCACEIERAKCNTNFKWSNIFKSHTEIEEQCDEEFELCKNDTKSESSEEDYDSENEIEEETESELPEEEEPESESEEETEALEVPNGQFNENYEEVTDLLEGGESVSFGLSDEDEDDFWVDVNDDTNPDNADDEEELVQTNNDSE